MGAGAKRRATKSFMEDEEEEEEEEERLLYQSLFVKLMKTYHTDQE